MGDRVLVRPFSTEEANGRSVNHGIILPESVTKEKSGQGKIVAVGPGRVVEGRLVPINLRVGEVVLFSKYAYDEVEFKGEELYLLKEENILAVIKK